MANNNQKVVAGAGRALEQMKYEVAQKFGVQLGPETASRLNGAVGGEIVRRLVAIAEKEISGQ